MSDIYLGRLAALHADWSSTKLSVIAGNVANGDTKGFKTKEISSFEDTLARAQTAERAARFSNSAFTKHGGFNASNDKPWDVYHSTGNVNLAHEMIKAGDVASGFELNTSIMRSFHRMMLAAFGN